MRTSMPSLRAKLGLFSIALLLIMGTTSSAWAVCAPSAAIQTVTTNNPIYLRYFNLSAGNQYDWEMTNLSAGSDTVMRLMTPVLGTSLSPS